MVELLDRRLWESLKDGSSLNNSYLIQNLLTVDLRLEPLLVTVDLRLETYFTIEIYLRLKIYFTIDLIL